ncbi:MAG TPA: hypothetical protein PKJ37_02395 [Acidobacteriota bacterium]|nr:hypothetical protein [Acidobacteriota bacterium]
MDCEITKEVLKDFILPTSVGLLAYFLTTGWASRNDRKNQSKLGMAILEAFMEEIRNGIRIMESLQSTAKSNDYNMLLFSKLPRGSWAGMASIPDSVLLRILAVSKDLPEAGYPVRGIKIHCKNYFEHICINYDTLIEKELPRVKKQGGDNWCDLVEHCLGHDDGLIANSKKVYQMLENAHNALNKNSKARLFPK